MQETKKQNYLKGAAILAAASIFVKIIGAVYKIPIFSEMGVAGVGAFQVTYNIYTLILTIATAGVPVAISRMVSAAAATGNTGLVKRYFSVALPAFSVIGVAAMMIMFLFADNLAGFMNNSLAGPGIRVMAPAVFFVCIISVYRGYTQGFENMIPTAASQVVEVLCKAAFGIAATFWLSSRNYGTAIVSAGAITGVTIGLGLCIPLLIWHKRKQVRLTLPADDKGISQGCGALPAGSPDELPGRMSVLANLFKVSVPITLGASFMAIMVVVDSSVVLGRLQSGLSLSEYEASSLFGIYTLGLTIYNLPPALVVPVSISIIPAIAAALARKRGNEAGEIMQSAVKIVNLLAMPACAGIMVLASPILVALYNNIEQVTINVLVILGAASFFVCLQLITTAILQANGYEKLTMITFPVGAALRISLGYFLVVIPEISIVGSSIGTLACFVAISALNIIFIIVKVKARPKFSRVFIKPLLCAAAMAGAAYSVYALVFRIGSGIIGTGRAAVAVYLAASIVIAVVVYAVLIIVTRTLTKEDIMLIPKGEKLAKFLRIR